MKTIVQLSCVLLLTLASPSMLYARSISVPPQPVETQMVKRIPVAVEPVTHQKADPATVPCEPGHDNRASDLCAQWKAADGAAMSARWTKWTGIFTGIGLVVGGATFLAAIAAAIYARDAAIETSRSADIAGEAVTEARVSAQIAADALEENRKTRRLTTLPILTIESPFTGLNLTWPWPVGHDPATMASGLNAGRSVPSHLLMKNQGHGAARDLDVTFNIDQPIDPISINPPFNNVGLSLGKFPVPSGEDLINLILPSGAGWPIYRTWTTTIAVCDPGQTIELPIPYHLLIRIFVMGLGSRVSDRDDHMTVTVQYASLDGEELEQVARFRLVPFCHGPELIPEVKVTTFVHWEHVPTVKRSHARPAT